MPTHATNTRAKQNKPIGGYRDTASRPARADSSSSPRPGLPSSAHTVLSASTRSHHHAPVQFKPSHQFDLDKLNDEYDHSSTPSKFGLGLFGSVVGGARGADEGARAGFNATAPFQGENNSRGARAAGTAIGGIGGLIGGIGGGVGGALVGGLHGLGRGAMSAASGTYSGAKTAALATGRGLSAAGRATKSGLDAAVDATGRGIAGTARWVGKHPKTTLAGLGVGGFGALNIGLAAGGASAGTAYLGANMSAGGILGGTGNIIKGGAEAYRWMAQHRHNQTKWGTTKSIGRGLHNVSKVVTSGAHAGRWINKAAGGTMSGPGQSLFGSGATAAANGTAATNAASQGLQIAGNIGAIGGIVSGGIDMLRGGHTVWKHGNRNRRLNSALGNMNEDTESQNWFARTAGMKAKALNETDLNDRQRARAHVAGLSTEEQIKREAALKHIKKYNQKKMWSGAARGVGGAMIAGGAALSATGVGALAGSGIVMAGMAAQAAPGAYRGVKQFFRDSADAKRSMSHAQWESIQNAKIAENKKRAKGAHWASRLSYFGKRSGLRLGKWWNRKGWEDPTKRGLKKQSYKDWRKEKERNYQQREAPTGWGSSFKRLGRWMHHKATLGGQANWDKSTKKKKAAHISHATALLEQDPYTRNAGLAALGLNNKKYANKMDGKSLLAQSAGYKDWDSVDPADQAKLIARVMRKGGVQEAAVSLKEKRESDAYYHARREKRGETHNDIDMHADESVNTHKMDEPVDSKTARAEQDAPDVEVENPLSTRRASASTQQHTPLAPWEMKRDYRPNLHPEVPDPVDAQHIDA